MDWYSTLQQLSKTAKQKAAALVAILRNSPEDEVGIAQAELEWHQAEDDHRRCLESMKQQIKQLT